MTKQLSKNQQKLVRDLRKSKKARMKNRCFIVEGLKNVAESIKSNYEVRFVVISDDFIK
jgi:TrmH family RNA methyltransferase